MTLMNVIHAYNIIITNNSQSKTEIKQFFFGEMLIGGGSKQM